MGIRIDIRIFEILKPVIAIQMMEYRKNPTDH